MRLLIKIALGLVAVVVVYLGVTFGQVWWAARHDQARRAQAIVVFGTAQYNGRPSPVLAARLDHAVDLYHRQLAPVIDPRHDWLPMHRGLLRSRRSLRAFGRGEESPSSHGQHAR